MTGAQLTFYSSWASIIGLAVSLVSLVYVRSIRANIIKFRRKQRIRRLIDEILQIRIGARPIASASLIKLQALKRNLPIHFWSRYTPQGRARMEIHRFIDALDLAALREAIIDLLSYSEDL